MADSTNEPPGAGATSAGALLRAAREKQGLHIAALAAAIKVAPRKLDALENDRWHELPDATFTRALAQTVCRTLKIDARPVLALLPATGMVALEPLGNALNEPFRERPGHDVAGFGASAIRPMIWAALVLMVAAVVVYYLPPGLWSTGLGLAVAPQAAPAASVPASAPVPSPAPAASVPALADAATAVAGAVTSSATAGETVFLAPDAAPSVAASAATLAPVESVAPAALVQLRSTEPSWVDARDARGAVLLSRTVQPGESVGLNGPLPIRLTVGNAAATALLFRGQPVDLVARTRDNVARVDLQ